MIPLPEQAPVHPRPLEPGSRWLHIEVPAHGAAVEMISRLSRRSGFSFPALTAFALHYFAAHGEKLLREEATRAASLESTRRQHYQ